MLNVMRIVFYVQVGILFLNVKIKIEKICRVYYNSNNTNLKE